MDQKRYWKKYGLWQTKCQLNYLQRERPLIFNIYDENSGELRYSTYHLETDELQDPNKRITVANVDYEIAETIMSIRRLEEQLNREREAGNQEE